MIASFLADAFASFIEVYGYPAIFVLMALESMIAPVPSELVMPFAGYVAAQGKLDFVLVNVFALGGSLLGSLVSYYAGKILGRKLVVQYGRWLGLRPRHLEWTEKWFNRHGTKTVFIARFIPVVRHLISIPAGISRMALGPFLAMTLVGATLWNGFLAYLGMALRGQYGLIVQYSEALDILIVILLLIALLYAWKKVHEKRSPAP